MKTLAELRSSDYHQELAHKLWAAFVAQQQGISMNMALAQTGGRMSDAWLMVAELALWAHASREGQFLGDQSVYDQFAKAYQAICHEQHSSGSLPSKVSEAGTIN